MGIFCQINLNKPPDGAFNGGEVVSGLIKYALDEPMDMDKITVSIKGIGLLKIIERSGNKGNRVYVRSEVYVDNDAVIKDGKQKVQQGSYEVGFNFQLPQNIPPSFKYFKHINQFTVDCKIKYYVRIKFDRSGLFAVTKHYRKKITVISTVTPRLSLEPVIHGKRSKLLQLFSSKTSMINMKASILNSAISNGGKIEIQSEIENDTNLNIKSVEIKLIEKYTFKITEQSKLKPCTDVPNCDSKTGSVKSGTTQTMPIDIIVPSDIVSLENSDLVSRDYIVRITAVVPMPHKNVVLEIPVQICDKIQQRDEVYDPPPTYWEAMGEAMKDDDVSDDEAGDHGKEEKS